MADQDLPTLRLPWGQGLDRASGQGVVSPVAWSDIRNVDLANGKAQVRAGMASIGTLAGMDEVIAVIPLRAAGKGIVVGYERTTRTVNVFVTASNGQNPTALASPVWFTAEAAVGVPRVIATETYGKIFLAHEFQMLKPGATYLRGPTQYYDPTTGTLTSLTADLDRSGGAETLRFRGVMTYLNYLIGWGYGTGSDEDTPEIVRVSVAGDPLTWVPEHYAAFGKKGVPVIACLPGSKTLIVFKESWTFELVGYDRKTFGVRSIDENNGMVSPRMGVSVDGRVYFWSYSGPKVNAGGGPATDLAVPLDVGAPDPEDLVDAGDASEAFCYHDEVKRTVNWCWPNVAESTMRVYTLSVRDPRNLRLSYQERGKRGRCVATFYPVAPTPPPGHPDLGVIVPNEVGAEVPWDNTGALGDEVTEFWLQDVTGGGDWYKHIEYNYESASMSKGIVGLASTNEYNIALRHRRGSLYNAGAESEADPSAWPAASVGNFTTLDPATPPGFFFEVADKTSFSSGGVDYVRQRLQWLIADPIGTSWAIYENTVDDFGTATVVKSGTTHDNTDPASNLVNPDYPCLSGDCVTTEIIKELDTRGPPVLPDFYYWILIPGAPEFALVDNPINYGYP